MRVHRLFLIACSSCSGFNNNNIIIIIIQSFNINQSAAQEAYKMPTVTTDNRTTAACYNVKSLLKCLIIMIILILITIIHYTVSCDSP